MEQYLKKIIECKIFKLHYNNYRYQWNLKKMSPIQYRTHLFKTNNK